MTDTWIHACRTSELEIGSAKVAKGEHDGQSYQVAVFRTAADAYYATDNLCPHEGYPLVQGYVKDCVLTCAWHNFKFRLSDGECVKGDEAVTAHPLRVRGDAIEFQLASKGLRLDIPKTFASLEEGLLDMQMGRVARDVVRLLKAGVAPQRLLITAARYDSERAEWGTNHGLPVAVDAMTLLDRYTELEAALPILQAMECAAERNIRRPIRALVGATPITESASSVGAAILEHIEAEDYPQAEGLLLGALAEGWGRAEIEPWFLSLCCEHFLGFGHPLIYTIKTFDFLDVLGFEQAVHLLPALLYRIANSTREDTLPPMRFLADRLTKIQGQFELWRSHSGSETSLDAVEEAILNGTKHQAFDAIEQALSSGASAEHIVDALSVTAATRLSRFDPAIDADNTCQENWLDITHGLTYAHAIRKTLQRYDGPETIRLLFFSAHFTQRTRPLDCRPLASGDAPPKEQTITLGAVLTAIHAKDSPSAVSLTRQYLARTKDITALREACEDYAIGDNLTIPIIVAHAIKTCIAAFEEYEALNSNPMPILGLVHFFASPIRERAIGRNVHEAIRFIAHGRPPKRLTL